ncbi:MAG: hypothetical protein ACLFM7_07990 [Bacteroidales bacterium]
MLFLHIMRNLSRHTLIFLFYLAGLNLLVHSFIPHEHHYGNEPAHILNEVKKEGLHDREIRPDLIYFTDKHDSYICHFNPRLFLGQDDLTGFFFFQTRGSVITHDIPTDIIKPFYGVNGYGSVILRSHSSRAPPYLSL